MATHLRTEALALPVCAPTGVASGPALDQTQQEALRRILALLEAAIGRIESRDASVSGRASDRSLFPDDDRSSRIVLLSGERGTGKTTVLLSLDRVCENVRMRLSGAGRRSSEEAVPEDLRPVAELVGRRTVWLEHLDMEPLPNSTNLLAAILARVDAAARQVSTQSRAESVEQRGYRGLLEGGSERDPLLRLRRFQTDVALSWQGNLESRQGSLDPDVYAVEVLRAERARLSLNENLKQVLNGVAQLFRGNPVDNPIFVLPVDDFDLNPPRSLDLLRLLRAISVPRLFTIVLGDAKVAEVIINLKLSSELAEVAGQAGPANLLSVPDHEVKTMASELASHAVRKLLPPAQITRLSSMTPTEALCYTPPGESVNLYTLLGKCPIKIDRGEEDMPPVSIRYVAITNLQAFMLTPSYPLHIAAGSPAAPPPATAASTAAQIKETVLRGAYQAKALFRTSPRRIADLWLGLQEIIDTQTQSDQCRALINLLGLRCRNTIGTDSLLSPAVRSDFLKAFSQTSEGDWEFDSRALEVEPDVGFSTTFEVLPTETDEREDAEEEPRQSVHAFPVKGWYLYPRISGTGGGEAGPGRLEENTASLLMLFQDLQALGPSRTYASRRLSWKPLPSRRVVFTHWRLDYHRCASMAWPRPEWRTFWENDLLFDIWNRTLELPALSTEYPSKDRLAFLVYTWIDASTAILSWNPPQGAGELRVPPSKSDWVGLISRLKTLHQQSSRNAILEPIVRDWFIGLACLLMPETIGLQPSITQPFAQANWLNKVWKWDANEFRRFRNDRLSAFDTAELNATAEKFRGMIPEGFPPQLLKRAPPRQPRHATGGTRPRHTGGGTTLE